MTAIVYNHGTGARELAPAEAGYLAGITDGEGSLTIGRARKPEHRSGYAYIALFTIANTDYNGLLRIVQMCGGGKIQVSDKRTVLRHRPCYRVMFSANQIRQLLPQIQPYLLMKQRQAELLLEFLESKVNGRRATAESWQGQESLRAQIRGLNRRGLVEVAEEALTVRQALPTRVGSTCSIDGCGRTRYGQGWCYDHYYERVIKPKREAAKAAVDRARVCGVCGKEFRAARVGASPLCSKRCRGRAYYQQHAERIKAQVAAAKARRKASG